MITKFFNDRLMFIANVLPLIAFVWAFRFLGNWEHAFEIGGLLSLVYIVVSLHAKKTEQSFMLAIHCFLLGGACMFLLEIDWLQNIYAHFLYATLFLWLFIVGCLQTIYSPAGFVGLPGAPRERVVRASCILLLATFAAFLFAWKGPQSMILVAVLPFIALNYVRVVLQKMYE
ncbi:hypothetical protein K2X40_00645 [Candidatus Babeliales bacterium]|nr:hypothetical protein [Candidatus Babeliales bacterium]